MDPQKLAGLDPKLRDAYQRVMGTTIPEPTAPSAPISTPTPVTPDPTSQPQPTLTPEPTMPTPTPAPVMEEPTKPIEPIMPPAPEPQPTVPVEPTPAPAVEPQPITNPQPQVMPEPAQPTSNFVQMNSEVATSPNFSAPAPQAQTMAIKKKGKMMPVLFTIVGLIFVVIYTIFWAKILNFKLPFLP